MTIPPLAITDITQAIQLALAPVFLLTGIAGILNVMAGRLARIIDRGRFLSESDHAVVSRAPENLQTEFANLERRRHLASTAITACTLSALLVCTVVTTLFLEVLLGLPMRVLVALLFACSTLTLVVGLAYFLREVHLATRTVRISGSNRPR